MNPAKLDLPTIWRGCDWGPVVLKWKDANGQPIDVTYWTPKAHSLHIDLHATKTHPVTGETQLLLTRDETLNLKLGVEQWDWIWERINPNPPRNILYRFPPFLAGKIQIKDPVSSVTGDTSPDSTEGSDSSEITEEPPIFSFPQ